MDDKLIYRALNSINCDENCFALKNQVPANRCLDKNLLKGRSSLISMRKPTSDIMRAEKLKAIVRSMQQRTLQKKRRIGYENTQTKYLGRNKRFLDLENK